MRSRRYLHIVAGLAAGLFLTLLVALLATQPGRAGGPWYVTPGGDNGNDCLSPATPCATINEAIGKASPGDTIYVAIGTYTGTGGDVVKVDKDVSLSGGWDVTFTTQTGTSTIDGQLVRRCILVSSGVTAVVERFTLQRGSVDSYGAGGVGNDGTLTLNDCTVQGSWTEGAGKGIENYGTLTLNGSTVEGHRIVDNGGGIENSGTLTLNDSTVRGNVCDGHGGGICNFGGTLTLNASSVDGNTSGGAGGGIYSMGGAVILNNSTVSNNAGGGVFNWDGTVTLYNSTVSGNSAVWGGGIRNYTGSGSVTLQNTILAGNGASGSGPDCDGTVGSSGYNLIGETTGCNFLANTGDLLDVRPRLVPLAQLLGYYPLRPDSPAIDAGNPAGCTDHLGNPLVTDQRGTPRPLDGDGDGNAICDMGAYEVDPEHPIVQVYLPVITRGY